MRDLEGVVEMAMVEAVLIMERVQPARAEVTDMDFCCHHCVQNALCEQTSQSFLRRFWR